jgi:hypothetical protein
MYVHKYVPAIRIYPLADEREAVLADSWAPSPASRPAPPARAMDDVVLWMLLVACATWPRTSTRARRPGHPAYCTTFWVGVALLWASCTVYHTTFIAMSNAIPRHGVLPAFALFRLHSISASRQCTAGHAHGTSSTSSGRIRCERGGKRVVRARQCGVSSSRWPLVPVRTATRSATIPWL